jgi:large subunit ribosomal protein L16
MARDLRPSFTELTDGADAKTSEVPQGDAARPPRKATKGNYVAYGDYGLQALEGAGSRARDRGRSYRGQHFLKREGKLFIRVFPDKPISKKPLETRMGTGKADVDYWAARVKPGTMLFEIAGVPEATARWRSSAWR